MVRLGLWAGGIVVSAGALTWLLFLSSIFAVTDIAVDGARAIGNEQVRTVVGDLLDQRTLHILQPGRNILFLNTAAVADAIREHYESIDRVAVEKAYPHTLRVTVTEREPVGIWCRRVSSEQGAAPDARACRYYNRAGDRWGEAVPSRGPLLLLVNDERSADDQVPVFVQALLAVADGLASRSLRVQWATLPDAAPGDLRIATSRGAELYLDALGDVQDQLATLEILLAEKATDSAWMPTYIDLRTPGRVYYK